MRSAQIGMESAKPTSDGPFRLVRMLHGTGLWTEHLAVREADGQRAEVHRLWLPKRGSIADEGAAAVRLGELMPLSHECLERIVEVSVAGRGLHVALEYEPGRTVAELAASSAVPGTLPAPVCLYLGIEVLKALAAAESFDRGAGRLHHGFIGPRSIYVTARGAVKLRYQGIAQACGWGVEALRGALDGASEELSRAADARAVALTLRGLLFPPSGSFVTGPEMPAGLIRVIARALSAPPKAAFGSAAELLSELRLVQAKHRETCTPIQMSELLQQRFGRELDDDAAEVEQLAGAAGDSTEIPADLRADRALPLGSVIDGRYRLLRELGQGSAGIVYGAEHLELRTQVAIKMLDRDYSRDLRRVERFRREARAASRIGHPNIIRVSDLGRAEDGRFFYVMELIDGDTLGEIIRREGRVDERRAVALMLQVCDALEAAHQKSVIHRDLKPENILVSRDAMGKEAARIVDFGLSVTLDSGEKRLTKEGQAVGTPYFMAPEQVRGESTDSRTDVYAAGAILYEMLAGVPLFDYPTVAETLTAHLHDTPIPLRERAPDAGISPALEAAVLKALEKDPLDRFQSMSELARALEGSLEPGAAAARPTGARRRVRLAVAALAVAAVVAAVIAGVASSPRQGDVDATAQAGDAGRPAADAGSAAPLAEAAPAPADAEPAPRDADAAVGASDGARGPAGTLPSVSRDAGPGESVPALTQRAETLMRQGKAPEAEGLYRRAVRQAPGHAAAWAGLGQAQFERGSFEQAAASLGRAVSLSPSSVRYRLLLAGALTRAGRSAEATRQYEAVLRLDPTNAHARRMLHRE